MAYPSFEARWPETVTQTSFPRNFGQKLPVHGVAIETDLLIFYGGLSTAEIGIRRKLRTTCRPGSGGSHSLSQRGAYFIRVEVNLRFRLRVGRNRRLILRRRCW